MPSKSTIRQFTEDGYYHVYNRGVEKRRIFQDREDYNIFIYYLKSYLSPKEELDKEDKILRYNLEKNNLADEVDLLSFCLMPNHFHFLLHQKTKNGISKFMRQLSIAYSMYFNKRNGRVGALFQGRFKTSKVETDEYLLHLSRYIHLNPIGRGASLAEFEWSSYLDYLGKTNHAWVKTQPILDYFKKSNPQESYKSFVEDKAAEIKIPESLFIETD